MRKAFWIRDGSCTRSRRTFYAYEVIWAIGRAPSETSTSWPLINCRARRISCKLEKCRAQSQKMLGAFKPPDTPSARAVCVRTRPQRGHTSWGLFHPISCRSSCHPAQTDGRQNDGASAARLIPQCPVRRARHPQHTKAIDWASLPGAVEQAPHV